MITIKLDDEYVEEVFEILSDLKYEETMYDIEPSTKRHPGIQQIINQLYIYYGVE